MSGYTPRPGFPGGGFQPPSMPQQQPGFPPAYSAMPTTAAQNSHQLPGPPPGHYPGQQAQQQMPGVAQPPFPSLPHQNQMANGVIPNGFPGMHPASIAPNRIPQPPTMPPSAFQQPPRPQTNGFAYNNNGPTTAHSTGNFGPPLGGHPTMSSPSPPDPSPHGMSAQQPFAHQLKPHPPMMPNQMINPSQSSNFQQPPAAMSNGPSLPQPTLPMPPVPGFQQPNVGQQQRPGFPPSPANLNQLQQQGQGQGQGQSYPGGPMQPQMPTYQGLGYGQQQQQQQVNAMSQDFNRMGTGPPAAQQQQHQMIDLMQERHILSGGCPEPHISLPPTVINGEVNCDPDVFRCTLTAIPQTQELLKKCRLPLGLTLHPFRDMKNLNVINTSTIVRCRACRTYINPFVHLPDQRHWKCNLCFRVNDLPDEFMWDPVTKSFGDPVRRPEIKYATVEFIAPGEYMQYGLAVDGDAQMREEAAIDCLYHCNPLQPVRKNLQGNNELRPPQAAVYVFVLDVSANAVESGYLHAFSEQFLINLDQMPGDNRTLMAFIAVDNGVHFFEFSRPDSPPKQIIATDVDEIFIPTNAGLLANVAQWKEEIRSFVQSLPTVFESSQSHSNALGAALTVAHEMIADMGGRITVVTTTLPDIGPGALKSREDPNQRAGNEVDNLGLATDFYKRLSLECTGHQIAMDLFMLNSKYADLATLSEMVKYGGGNVHHFPNYHILRETTQVKRFEKTLCRYLTRKIGFEAVLRIRCTKGLALHTFHGNFFVRSTDLLAVPNINPDTAMGVQVQMEENLTGLQSVCFQAALLYTSSKGDRRIRVHTMCLPVTSDLSTIHNKIDIKCTVSMLAKMAVERSIAAGGSLNDAREAMVNAAVDAVGSFNRSIPGARGAASLLAPTGGLRLFPLYVLGLLKHPAFVLGRSVKLDDRLAAMCMFKTAPIRVIMLEVYPALYPIHTIETQPEDPPELQLSYERVDRHGVYLLDTGSYMFLYVGQAVSDVICQQLFGVAHFTQIDEDNGLPELATGFSDRVRAFIRDLSSKRPFYAPLRVIREDSPYRELVTRRLIEDRTESSHSYVEFLQHVRKEVAR